MLKLKLCFLVIFLPFAVFCNNNSNLVYIQQYSKLAINEMNASGIPASIKLAQGILESSWGKSESAIYYNAHFGIKCKSSWDGSSFKKKDDDYDAQGNLIESCFRAYNSAQASYRDHSNFLQSNTRYRKLFQLDKTDYINWAIGLQQCGYATNKEYAIRLIDLIEKYNLQRFDAMDAIPVQEFLVSRPVTRQEVFTAAMPGTTIAVPVELPTYREPSRTRAEYLPFEVVPNHYNQPQRQIAKQNGSDNKFKETVTPPILPADLSTSGTNEEMVVSFGRSYDKRFQQIVRKPRMRSSLRR